MGFGASGVGFGAAIWGSEPLMWGSEVSFANNGVLEVRNVGLMAAEPSHPRLTDEEKITDSRIEC